MRLVPTFIIQMRTLLMEIQHHAHPDTGGGVSGETTAHLQIFNLASPSVLSHPKMKVFPCLDQRMTPSVALCTPQNRELFPASFLFRTESLVSHSVTISLFPQPRHLTRERFNDAIYIHWILIGLNSNAVSTFWITAININVITCQF